MFVDSVGVIFTAICQVTWQREPLPFTSWSSSLSCAVMIEMAGFSENFISIYQTSRRHIPEDRNLAFFYYFSLKFSKF